jgi:hypothetical protein
MNNHMLPVFMDKKQTSKRTGIQRAASEPVGEMHKYKVLTIFASYGPLVKELPK